jgi:hypothetical protein
MFKLALTSTVVIPLALVGLYFFWGDIFQRSTPTLDYLAALMNKREELWFTPAPAGTRDSDLSKYVCDLVTPEILQEAAFIRPNLIKVTQNVRRGGMPEGTDFWVLQRPSREWFVSQVLGIYIGPNGYCEARFRLVK